MRKKILPFGGLLLLLLIGRSVVAISTQDVDLRDAYHYYCDFQDGEYDSIYKEWWYFNLFDTKNDIQIIFHYSILDPENISGDGMAGVGAVVYIGQDIVNHTDWLDSFSPSCQSCDDVPNCDKFTVDIGHNYIEMTDSNTYHIFGSIRNGRLSWDLTYKSQIDPWFAHDGAKVKVGLFPWEQMSWFIHMPGAYVSGEVWIDDQYYEVKDALGYHDHNWGEWIPYNVLWNWAQYFEPAEEPKAGELAKPALAFQIGDFRFKPIGVVSIEHDDIRTEFEKDEYLLIHSRWRYDSKNRKWFPVKTWLYAENEKRRLIVCIRAIKTEAMLAPLEMPFFLPEVILYEQTAYYMGRLWEKEGGRWQLRASFNGNGFKEYSALKWQYRINDKY